MHLIGPGAPVLLTLAVLAIVGFIAGVQNSLAGGGSFLTFPVLLLSGLPPRAANISSAVALFPGQLMTGYGSRQGVVGIPGLSVRTLFVISVAGGALGALLLLATPSDFFTALVPWLVLFATTLFAWASFVRDPASPRHRLNRSSAILTQLVIAAYGGYFGGGISILMLATLTMSGWSVRGAWATKNLLAAVMNAAAILIFAFSRDVAWKQVVALGAGAIVGGQVGAYAFQRVNEKVLQVCITLFGLGLAIGLFWHAHRG
jgi:uncharacterized membrane protein YfcA